jgi:hypothetical protein
LIWNSDNLTHLSCPQLTSQLPALHVPNDEPIVEKLDDTKALRIFAALCENLPHQQEEWSPETVKALMDQLGVEPLQRTVSEADIARSALNVIAVEDEDAQVKIRALSDLPPDTFDFGLTQTRRVSIATFRDKRIYCFFCNVTTDQRSSSIM